MQHGLLGDMQTDRLRLGLFLVLVPFFSVGIAFPKFKRSTLPTTPVKSYCNVSFCVVASQLTTIVRTYIHIYIGIGIDLGGDIDLT
jgi:hypothetical protein